MGVKVRDGALAVLLVETDTITEVDAMLEEGIGLLELETTTELDPTPMTEVDDEM